MEQLIEQARATIGRDEGEPDVTRGTLISREQYLVDITEWGYSDARMQPRGPMSATEIAHWTEAIGNG